MKARIVAVLIALFGSGFCLVRAYSVEPHSAQQSGWTHGEDGYVAQQVVACWDSLERVELFAGAKGNGGTYHVTVYDGGTPLMSSDGTQTQNESWVKFFQWDQQVAFTKGKTLTIRFTRGGNGSVQLYCSYRATTYGSMAAAEELDSSSARLIIA